VSAPSDLPVDTRMFRRVAAHFPTGVTIISCRGPDGAAYGMTANSFVSVSTAPPTVLIAVKHGGRMHQYILASGEYGVSVLRAADEQLCFHFAGRPVPDLVPSFELQAGIPVLADAVATFACRVEKTIDVHDHSLFVARVLSCRDAADAADAPLLYFNSACHAWQARPTEPSEANG
jgi:flavin reductase (DIM6/NTAB) family NADH-FMN oxidoreductase RutF